MILLNVITSYSIHYTKLYDSLSHEILTLAQLYRDRGDAENPFDELKNHWGWGGFTTRDLKRCRFIVITSYSIHYTKLYEWRRA